MVESMYKNKEKCYPLSPINEDIEVREDIHGKKYAYRKDRRRYFFPDEWNSFISIVKKPIHKLFFYTALFTGGRMMEILNLKYGDIDIERGVVTFRIVKQRKAKRNFYAIGKTRSFFLCSNYIKQFKSFIRGKTINTDDYIFLNNKKLPVNYSELNNEERKKYFKSESVKYYRLTKRYIKRAGIKDWYNFSPHNFRKTYGMWIRIFLKDSGELCYRMGHDINTYIAHYGSSLIFTEIEIRKIERILGDVK